VVGVDLGGTKILAGVVDRLGGVERRHERPTPTTSQDELLAALERAVNELVDDDIAAIGFGMPSRIDQASGRVEGSVNIPIAGVPLRDLMSERFGVPVGIANDASAATLAEFHVGAGREAKTLVMLTLGTGVGGGVVIDGRLLRDGGELGHVVVEYDGAPCQGTCTGRGHLEGYASGTAATKLAREAFGADATAHDLVRLGHEGDPTALSILGGIGGRLGAAIGSFVNIFRPEIVVVGGGFAAAGDLILGPAREVMLREALTPARDRVRIVRADLGPAAGVIGAGLVALHATGAAV
jgi:glucokinase